METVEIFTDGSCFLHDNGRGGYGAVLIYEDFTKEIYGGYYKTSNNRMELYGVIKAVELLQEPYNITIYSDSRYVTEAFNKKWIDKWLKKDFKGIKNTDLWKLLLKQIEIHNITFVWVKSHSGNLGNIRADELATTGASLPNLIQDRFT